MTQLTAQQSKRKQEERDAAKGMDDRHDDSWRHDDVKRIITD